MRLVRVGGVLLAVCGLALGLSGPAGAAGADAWLQLDPLAPSVAEEIRVRFLEGKPFRGRELAFDDSRVELLQRLWRNGRRNLGGEAGRTPMAAFRVDRPGVQLVVYSGRSADSPVADTFCKAVVVVGTSERRDPLRWSEVGQRLELVPQSDPVGLVERGGRLEVQLLYEREPLADTVVTAVPETDSKALRTAKTDEIGVVGFELDRPGRWVIAVQHRARCSDCGTPAPVDFRASITVVSGGGSR